MLYTKTQSITMYSVITNDLYSSNYVVCNSESTAQREAENTVDIVIATKMFNGIQSPTAINTNQAFFWWLNLFESLFKRSAIARSVVYPKCSVSRSGTLRRGCTL